jgi:hypothetical protein
MTDPKHETGSVEVVKPVDPPPPAPSSTFQKPAPSAMAPSTGAAAAVADTHEPFMQLTSMGTMLYALDRSGRVWQMQPQGHQVWLPLPTQRAEQ